MSEEFRNVGQRVKKLDGYQKVTGKANYPQDLKFPGMLFGKIKWSEHAHAKIISIDTSKAEKLPGVVTVITAKDIPPNKIGIMRDNPVLKSGKVRSHRDEVAAVAAVDEETAEAALDMIKVEYEPLPTVFDPEEALKEDSPQLHEHAPGNKLKMKYDLKYGDVEKAKAESDVILSARFKLTNMSHCPLGPWSCTASWDKDGRLTMHSPTQVPFLYQKDLAEVLGIPGSKVRVIQPTIGGAFGAKLDMYPNEVICAHLAKKTGKPVQLTYTREEEFKGTPTRQPAIVDLTVGAKKDGTLTFRDVFVTLDNGAYTSWGATIPYVMMNPFTSLYKCQSVRFKTQIVFTNNMYAGAMRGYGNPQGTFALESLMDDLAEKIGMDPLELRMKNCNQPNEETLQGFKVTTCGLPECLKVCGDRIGWSEKRGKGGDGKLRRGVGIASFIHVGGGARVYLSDGCGAMVKYDDFGHITVITGTTEIGQGSETVIAQIVAEVLGANIEDVSVVNTDTDIKPWDVGVHASRTTFIGGNAAKLAAAEAKKKILSLAAEQLEKPVDDLTLRDGKVVSIKDGEELVPTAKVVRKAHFTEHGKTIVGEAFYDPPTVRQGKNFYGNISATYGFGTQAAEVEVDTETGHVRVVNIVSATDVGRAINPMSLEGQMEGGVAMGIGYALLEECKFAQGKMLNTNFTDYKMPTSMDIPDMETVIVETVDKDGPFGAKGIGEAGAIPTGAAIANAVKDALGFRIYELPMTPEVVHRAIKEHEKKE